MFCCIFGSEHQSCQKECWPVKTINLRTYKIKAYPKVRIVVDLADFQFSVSDAGPSEFICSHLMPGHTDSCGEFGEGGVQWTAFGSACAGLLLTMTHSDMQKWISRSDHFSSFGPKNGTKSRNSTPMWQESWPNHQRAKDGTDQWSGRIGTKTLVRKYRKTVPFFV